MPTKINGLTVDCDAIGAGLYDIITDAGQAPIVAVGMIPKWLIDGFETLTREKVRALMPGADKAEQDRAVAEIVKAVCSGIYSAAAARGRMLV